MNHGSLQDFITYLKTRTEPMDISLFDRLRPFLSKIIAPLIVSALAWAANKTGVVALTDTQFQETMIAVVMWAITSITHTAISKKTNPGNTASAHLAAISKVESERLKV